MVLAYLGTFTFCGYWHGPTLGFVVWGVYHAVGLIVFDVVRANVMRRRLKNKVPPPKGARALVGRVAATACTFTFVSLGWIPFALPLGRLFGSGGGAP
jgi:alginate O-acetyltransferase complex protein AlgI